jgi:glutaredoxin
MQTHVLGLSVDSVPSLKAWAESLGGITYPLLSDFYPHGAVAKKYGVLRPEGHSERALFVLDRGGILRWAKIYELDTQPDNDELLRVLSEIDPQAAAWLAAHLPAGSEAEPQAEVVMYCTSWCPGCRRARIYFEARGIEYVEVDIARDRAAAARLRAWADGNETTPTFNIRGKIIVGFDEQKLDEALGRRG